MIRGHRGCRDTRPGLQPGAVDLTLLGEHIRKGGGGELLLGWAYLGPAPMLAGRQRELRADVSFCSF